MSCLGQSQWRLLVTDSNQIFNGESHVLLKAFADVISSLAPTRIQESGSLSSLLILLSSLVAVTEMTMKAQPTPEESLAVISADCGSRSLLDFQEV